MKAASQNNCREVSSSAVLSVSPVVSVLMITYNHAPYLAQAIENVVNQAVDFPIELIIGEDCSTDNTRQVALDYQQKFPHIIRVLFSENNVGVNRNYARTLLACRGEFVACCEGDDYWTDKLKLKKQVSFLRNNSQYVASYHDSQMVNSDASKIIEYSSLGDSKNDYTGKNLQTTVLMPTQTLCFRNVIRELPPEFYRVVAADAFVISMLGAYGGAKFQGDVGPSVYRVHDGGIWSGIDQEMKQLNLITVYFWLCAYHRRISNRAVSVSFARTIAEHALKGLDVDFLSAIKTYIRVYFPELVKFLVVIKRML